MRRRPLGEEAGEMRRQRPVRPRVILNRDAVWALLDRLGISQNELARRCGLSPGYMSLLMAGKRSPSPPTRRRLMQVLGVASSRTCSPGNPAVSNGRSAETWRPYRPTLAAQPGRSVPSAQPGCEHKNTDRTYAVRHEIVFGGWLAQIRNCNQLRKSYTETQ